MEVNEVESEWGSQEKEIEAGMYRSQEQWKLHGKASRKHATGRTIEYGGLKGKSSQIIKLVKYSRTFQIK